MSNHQQQHGTVTYELQRRDEEDQWHYHTSDWDLLTDPGPIPTDDELTDMLTDWLSDNDETTGVWCLSAFTGPEDALYVVESEIVTL